MSFPTAQHRPSAFVLYGSETGNAQDLADDIGRMFKRLRFFTYVSHLNAISLAALPADSLVVIAISTTGQGDFPSNASVFWKGLLRKKLNQSYAKHVSFTVFGLGDSSYPKYNHAARKLHKRISQLGAVELYQRGEADEQHEDGSDATFIPWLDGLRQHLIEAYPFESGQGPLPDDAFLEPEMTLGIAQSGFQSPNGRSDGHAETSTRLSNVPSNGDNHMPTSSQPNTVPNASPTASPPQTSTQHTPLIDLQVTLAQNRRITPSTHFQDVRHLIFTTPQNLHYLPGDVLTIYPQNPEKDVRLMLAMMDWTSIADEPLTLYPSLKIHNAPEVPIPVTPQLPVSPDRFPHPFTLRALLTDIVDINAIPRRSFFSTLSHFTTDKAQRSRLIEFASPEFSEELHDYATRPRRSILETLHDFHTVRIPFKYALAVLPILRGRQFSIASGGELLRKVPFPARESDSLQPSSAVDSAASSALPSPQASTRIDVLIAIVSYRTVLKRLRQGTCSRYVASLPTGSQVHVMVQRGSFGFDVGENRPPVLLIGPGTGLAPMRALIWERKLWAEHHKRRWESLAATNGEAEAEDVPYEGFGETVLLFGARSRRADYFFQDEWASLAENPLLPFRVLTAFSRDAAEEQEDLRPSRWDPATSTLSPLDSSPSPSESMHNIEPSPASGQVVIKAKPYVQSLIRAHAELVYDILHNKGGKIYVCGSAGAMPRGVREAVVDVFQRVGATDREHAEREVGAIEQAGRWIVECW